MTKLEEVARAICVAMGEGPDRTEEHCLPGSYQTDQGEPHWRGYINHARAAVEALREPTGLMIDAGQPWSVGDMPPNCWVKMIDAILTESP